jgi:hypothetical protein
MSHSNLYSIGHDQHITTNVTNNAFVNFSAGDVTSVISRFAITDQFSLYIDQERRTIVDWLSPLNFKVSQSEFLQKREHGTGQWLLESQEFLDWRDGTSETLWCPGPREITSLVVF